MFDLAAGRQPQLDRAFRDLLPLAEHHRLAARLAKYYPEDAEAREYGLQAAVREARMGAVQQQLVSQLKKAGVRAWAYKGPLLGKRLRLDASRESKDIDILVRREDYDKAERVVREGWEKVQTHAWRSGPHDDHLALLKDSRFVQGESEPWVELHWSLFLRCYRESMDELVWEQLKENEDIDDALLFCILAHHAAYHGMCRLRWAADLVILNSQAPSAARSAQILASQSGSRTLVDSAIRFLEEDLSIAIDHEALASPSSRLVKMWRNHLASENLEVPGKWEDFRTIWAGCQSPASKTQFLTCIVVERFRRGTKLLQPS